MVLFVDRSVGMKFIRCEIEFDAVILQVTGIERGELLKEEQEQGQFFNTFDNGNGKIRLNITLSESHAAGGLQELAILYFKAREAGKSELGAILFEVLDKNKKKIESRFSKITIEVKK